MLEKNVKKLIAKDYRKINILNKNIKQIFLIFFIKKITDTDRSKFKNQKAYLILRKLKEDKIHFRKKNSTSTTF
jgi:hypothetical protein